MFSSGESLARPRTEDPALEVAIAEAIAALLDLARRAGVGVTEDFPTGDVARARDRLAASAGVPVLAVDAACVLPMRLVGKAHERGAATDLDA